MNMIMQQSNQPDTHFLLSKHIREIGHSLRCFFEVDVVQSVYVPMLKETYYSVYVFLDCNSPDIIDDLLGCEDRILKLYPKDGFIYNYLEDDPKKVFAIGRIPIMIFNRENEE